MQVEQGFGAQSTGYTRSRSALLGDACTPSQPPDPSAAGRDHLTRKGKEVRQDWMSAFGRGPGLQPRKATDRNGLAHPTVMCLI